MKISYRYFIVVTFLYIISTNFIFFAKYVGHFGGGMTYAVVEAEKMIFKDYYGREPRDYDLNLYHRYIISYLYILSINIIFLTFKKKGASPLSA